MEKFKLPPEKNVCLIGMPGVGKSTIGILLAKALSFSFIDTDVLLQAQQNTPLQKIIDSQGLDEFLKVEENLLSSLCYTKTIIATGGSAIYSQKGMENLKETCLMLYLMLPFEFIQKRIQNIESRGIVIRSGNSLQDLYNERAPKYKKYGKLCIDCTNKNQETIVDEIVKALV